MGKDKSVKNNQCYVIMPISDPKEYESGHFRRVYEDIFIPAIEAAGFIPKRADDDKSSSMIQISIVKDIIESPMAICDLSTRNPNVLFELGIRQAFDLPVVLVQEMDTPRIFDISTINTIDYRKTLGYREVIEDRDKKTVTIRIDHAYLQAIEINPNHIIIDDVKESLLARGDIKLTVADYNAIERDLRSRWEEKFDTAANGQAADALALKMVKEVYEPVVKAVDRRYSVIVQFK